MLVAPACSDDDEATTVAGDVEAGGDGGGGLAISIVSPRDGDTVGNSFDVEVESDTEFGEPDTGLHHVHLYYDGDTDSGDYDIVYDNAFTVDRLDAGEHTIEAVIANADHSLTDARDQVTVTVGDEAGGTGGVGTTVEDDEPDPYGY